MSTSSKMLGDVVRPDMAPDGIRHPVLHHINLKTNRLDEMIEWYGIVVGMHPNFRSDTMAFLTNDAANHRIALLGLPGYTDDAERDNHCGMHHSGFEFASLEDLLTRYETLKAVGIVPVGCIDHGLTMSFYYADPDGNQVELQADNYEDWRTSTEWMVESEDFARDQIGKFVDPEKIVAAFRGGMTPMEIHEEAYWGTALDAPPVVFGPNGA